MPGIERPRSEAGEELSFVFAGEMPEQDAALGEIEQHLADLDQAFVVLGQPLVGGEPTDCSLNNPPACEHLETTRARRRFGSILHPERTSSPPRLDITLMHARLA